MALDRKKGEIIEGLGSQFRIVPNGKWRETKLFEEAATRAAAAFLKSGAMWPITFDEDDVLIQEYPADRKIAVLFVKKIRGQEALYPWVWELPDAAVQELAALGKWDTSPIN